MPSKKKQKKKSNSEQVIVFSSSKDRTVGVNFERKDSRANRKNGYPANCFDPRKDQEHPTMNQYNR